MKPDKETLRRLREENAQRVAAARENQKAGRERMNRVRQALAAGPATIPELAMACGLTPRETLWWVAALRKYGLAAEGAKQGAYFQYQAVEERSLAEP